MDVYHVCPISEIHTCKTGNVLILKKKKKKNLLKKTQL